MTLVASLLRTSLVNDLSRSCKLLWSWSLRYSLIRDLPYVARQIFS